MLPRRPWSRRSQPSTGFAPRNRAIATTSIRSISASPAACCSRSRGKVLEHGMPRFFRRLAEGVSDEADLAGKPVLLLSGRVDPIVPADSARHLADLLRGRGATVEHRVLPSGHDLGQADIALAKSWFEAFKTGDVAPER
ncbi:MAG: alpha/beta hydrolase [Alphaproteobacteria bacterium]